MQWPLALLVAVLLLSVLVSVLHWSLLSGVGTDTLLVPVQPPLARHTLSAQGSVEMDGQTERRKMNEEEEERYGKEGELFQEVLQPKGGHVKSKAPLQSAWYGGDDVLDPLQWSDGDQDEYTVLLDTGDYVLEEKDMDKVALPAHGPKPSDQNAHEWPPAARGAEPHFQSTYLPVHRHRQATHSTIQHNTPATHSTPQSKRQAAHPTMWSDGQATYSSPQDRGQEAHSTAQSDGHAEAAETLPTESQTLPAEDDVGMRSKETVEQGQAKVFQMTKESYYAKLALASERTSSSRPTSFPLSSPPGHAVPSSHRECSVRPCLEHLTSTERYIYTKCTRRTVPGGERHSVPSCKCRFVDRRGRRSVALVSLPGSGNTWVRGLLEKATGICTGSIYCDRTLREGGFCGEGLRGTNLIAVKTHDSSLAWRGGGRAEPIRPVFDKAIFLIRNPFRAIIAEWNRQISRKYASEQTGSSHVKYVSSAAFFGSQPGWDRNVRYLTTKWRLMVSSNLVRKETRPILVVFYEDLKRDMATDLKRMLDFLEHPYTPAQLNTTMQEGYTSYYRNHTDTFEHYTTEQKAFVNKVILQTAEMVGKTVHKDIASRLRDYALP